MASNFGAGQGQTRDKRDEEVNAMRAKGIPHTAIAKALGVARSSVYRYLQEAG